MTNHDNTRPHDTDETRLLRLSREVAALETRIACLAARIATRQARREARS
jgi:hypothetical protein